MSVPTPLTMPARARRWAGRLSLILVGVALGSVVVSPVLGHVTIGGVLPASIQHRAVSCAGSSFIPADSRTRLTTVGPYLYRTDTKSVFYGIFHCDPGLPDGAVVTQLRVTLVDFDNAKQVVGCELDRNTLAASVAGTYEHLASIPGTGVGAHPGKERLADDTISLATVDAAKYGYWIECTIDASANVGIYGAEVSFDISSTNG